MSGRVAWAVLACLGLATAAAAHAAETPATAAPAALATAPDETHTPFRYNAQGRRDPFMPLVRDGRLVSVQGMLVESSKPVLYGILWDPSGASLALINDAEVKVGDVIGSYRVSEIRKDAVVLMNGGSPVILQISFDTPPAPPAGGPTGGEGR